MYEFPPHIAADNVETQTDCAVVGFSSQNAYYYRADANSHCDH